MTKKISLSLKIFFSSLLIISLIYNIVFNLFLYNISHETYDLTYKFIYLIISLNVFYYSLGFLVISVAYYYNIVRISKNTKKYCFMISIIALIFLIFLMYLRDTRLLNPIFFVFGGVFLSLGTKYEK